MTQSQFRDVLERLRNKVAGVQAILILGPAGIVEYLTDGPMPDIRAFAAEYSTLLRVARRTSVDARTGELIEHIVISEKSVILARNLSPEHFLILITQDRDQLGRARYALKQLAWEIAGSL